MGSITFYMLLCEYSHRRCDIRTKEILSHRRCEISRLFFGQKLASYLSKILYIDVRESTAKNCVYYIYKTYTKNWGRSALTLK